LHNKCDLLHKRLFISISKEVLNRFQERGTSLSGARLAWVTKFETVHNRTTADRKSRPIA